MNQHKIFPDLAAMSPFLRKKWILRLAQHTATAWAVLLLALGLTGFAWYHFTTITVHDANLRFLSEAKDIRAAITKHMAEYETVLRGSAGLFDASVSVERDEWRRYVDALDVRRRYPGLQGIGFTPVSPSSELAQGVVGARAEGSPDNWVGPGETQATYSSTHYPEPFDPSIERTFGDDKHAQPALREAMNRARDSGELAVSSTVTVVQDSAQRPGRAFVMYLPVYRKGMPTGNVDQRRAALYGFVFSPARINELMQDVLGAGTAGIAVDLYDGEAADPARPFYHSASAPGASVGSPARSLFSQRTRLDIGSRAWVLSLHTLPGFVSSKALRARWVAAVGGTLGSFVLFFAILMVQGALAHATETNAELRRSEERSRALVEFAPDAIIVINEDGAIETCNPAACRFFGYSAEELVGRNASLLIPGPDHGAHDRHIARFLATGESPILGIGHDVQARRKDGSLVSVNLNMGEVKSVEGRRRFIGFMRDLSEHKLQEEALARYRDRLEEMVEERTAELAAAKAHIQLILESVADGLIGIDPKGCFSFANPAACRMLGYSETELVGVPVHDTIHHRRLEGAPFPEAECHLIEELFAGNTVRQDDEVYWRSDGQPLPVAVAAQPMLRDGKIVAGVVNFTDITERKRAVVELTKARADAEQASRTKSAFLATMSHEIRTPMNGVLGMVEILLRSRMSKHQADLLKIIRESGTVLLNLIDDILDFSKIEAGRLEIGSVPVSVVEVVEGLCTSLLPIATSKGVDLTLFVDPRIPERVLTDDVRLRQMLYNLVGNAIKFSGGQAKRRGHVAVRVEVVQGAPLRMAFSIIDNGIGIAPETLRTLFTPFTQAEVSTTRRFGGTGLGLAICKRLAELMQGEITVGSALGDGSTFAVELPFELPAEQPAAEPPVLAGVDCIVVENPGSGADDLSAYLEFGGARVLRAVNLRAAVDAAASLSAPVVVVQDTRAVQSRQNSTHARFARAPHLRSLLITRGRRRRARQADPDTLTLDGNVLRRQTLLHAVAALAGRTVSEAFHDPADEPLLANRARPSSLAEARAQGRLILVAEDDPINQKVIQAQLGLLGYMAEIANDGIEALGLWRVGQYPLMFTDLHMPEMDGYTLARTIRAEEDNSRRMPILALTANALRGEADHAVAAGMDDYLTKPVPIERLDEVLQKWVPLNNVSSLPAAPQPQAVRPQPGIVLDVAVLKALVGDDEEIVREFLSEYRASVRRLAADLRVARDAGNSPQVGAIAHKLKSSSRSVGALTLGEVCADLEHVGKARDVDGVELNHLRFEAALEEVNTHIAALLQE